MDMEIARPLSRWQRLLRWRYLGISVIVLVTLVMHFSIILIPKEPVFDEIYYVNDARSIIQGEGSQRGEHPPLGKLLVVAGVKIFGDNPLGWRFFAVILGTAAIPLFYFVCRKLQTSEKATLLATSLFALENMSFVQASIAMLDVYALFFTLAAFLFYLHGKYKLSGLSIGLSTLAKLFGALVLPVVFLHWLLTSRKRVVRFFIGMALAPVSFVALMPVFDFFVYRGLTNPIKQITTMLQASAGLTFATVTHEAARYPWQMIIKPELTAYWYNPDYFGTLSFTVWGLIIPVTLYMMFRAIKGSSAAAFGFSWFAGLFLIWIPLVAITNRVTYPYYIYPAAGALCLGIGLGLSELLDLARNRKTKKARWTIRGAVATYLLAHVVFFVIFSPVFNRFW